MLKKIREKYTAEGILQYFMNAGAGKEGAHSIVDAANPYNASNGDYVFAIETYTDGAKFAELEEGNAVDAVRLDAGGDGYPERAIITGKFTKIITEAGTRVAIFKK